MGKYPCGVCGGNVRSSAILCTGLCNKWFHFRCVNLTNSDVKKMELDESLEEWKCVSCTLNSDLNESVTDKIEDSNEVNINYSSLADEINKSVLQENEELKQELHLTKNKTSYYVFELEDRLKQYEDDMEKLRLLSQEKEQNLFETIKLLEGKHSFEKKAKENLILKLDEENKNNNVTIHKVISCDHCTIYKEEIKKMLDTIRTLESVIQALEANKLENQEIINTSRKAGNVTCMHCFPPFQDSAKQTFPDTDKWQKVPLHYSSKPDNSVNTETGPSLISNNPFSVLSDLSADKVTEVTECNDTQGSVETTRSKRILCKDKSNKTKLSNIRHNIESYQNIDGKSESTKKQKVLICGDSHGRDLAFHLNKCSSSLNTIGFVRPGGFSEQILSYHNIDGENLGATDVLVIACGTNDVAHNNARNALTTIKKTLERYKDLRIILLDLPNRYDLKSWSCVNEETRRTNKALEALSINFSNISLVKISSAQRHLHTQHGLHLNNLGKRWMARRIYEVLADVVAGADLFSTPSIIHQTSSPRPATHVIVDDQTTQSRGNSISSDTASDSGLSCPREMENTSENCPPVIRAPPP